MMRQEEIAGLLAGGVAGLACVGLFSWLPVLLGILISGVIVHLFLMLFGGANQGLTMTLRVISYAYAPQIFAVVPFVGGCIAAIWMLVLENHRSCRRSPNGHMEGCFGCFSAGYLVRLRRRSSLWSSYRRNTH
jgi:hypothetical protein